MTDAPTSYDQVPYPSMLFSQSHPDRLAVIARLHGLDPAPIATARVLQIGGGDGLDAIALAAAFPHAEFVNFDIATQPILRGRRWSEAARLTNVRHEVMDISDAADQLSGRFDYIIAHGIYAWVPASVRAAVMPLIRRLLAANGIAYVSYNTFPGGHSRLALREMIRHHVAHLTSPTQQLAAVRDLLRGFAHPQPNDEPITAAMRREATAALAQADGLLFHDVLNAFYNPQSLTAAVHDGQTHGLRYLGEASGGGLDKGFVDPQRAVIGEDELLHRLQAMDYRNGRYFRASLFVPGEAQFTRVAVDDAIRTMWVTTQATETADGAFRFGRRSIHVNDPRRAELVRMLIARRPARLPVADLADDGTMLASLRHYALEGVIELWTGPPPFALRPAARPQSSPLARMQATSGITALATLDHKLIEEGNTDLRRLIGLLDGTRDRTALQASWAESGASMSLDDALDLIAGKGLLLAETPSNS